MTVTIVDEALREAVDRVRDAKDRTTHQAIIREVWTKRINADHLAPYDQFRRRVIGALEK